VTRHADEPHKTVNVDLCFVPVPTAEKTEPNSKAIAAVSPAESSENEASFSYPGQVFADPDLNYDEAMNAYADLRAQVEFKAVQAEEDPMKAERAALRTDEEALRIERRLLRQQRKKEDQDWRAYRQSRRTFNRWWDSLDTEAKVIFRHQKLAADDTWRRHKARRRERMQERKAQDEQWRQARQNIRQRRAALDEKAQALALQWVAILVILDNCTRQCLALPLFEAGKHVTAEMVVAALRKALPSSLRFLISDNGAQFIAQAMTDLATELGFRQVRISPRRAKTNGIAERFVRTFREMLAWYAWQTVKELLALLPKIVDEYNDRPHRGEELNGLSPNEYARRLLAQATQAA
jgi:transposase InsO family protein